MAIYSLNLGFISRSAGRSAVGFSAYISGGKQQDVRTGVGYDYGSKNDVLVSRVLVLEGTLEWTKSSSTLWNAVEQFEDHVASLRFRGNERDPERHARSFEAKQKFLSSTQTAQTIMGAIPLEFTPQQAEACVEEFLQERFVSRGLIVEYAIHWDKGNPHFHGLITRRPLVDGQFAIRKDREIVTKAALFETRKRWEIVANKHLALGGHEVRMDSRSYEAQGLDLTPTRHEGWYAQALAERGEYSRIVSENDAIRQKNIEVLCKNPSVLIQDLVLKRTVFTHKHLEDEILRRVGGDEKLFSILKSKVEGLEIPEELILRQANDNKEWMAEGRLSSDAAFKKVAGQFASQLLVREEVISSVGENLNRETVFTSQSYKNQEATIRGYGDTLYGRHRKIVSEEVVEKAIQIRETELGFSLSEEQRSAITHLCSGPDIRVLNGKAGTGKTTLLKAVAESYQEAGCRVLGTSFQGKAVEIMEQEIGIPCKTLDSFKYAWEKHQHHSDLIQSGKLWGRPYQYSMRTIQELTPHLLTEKDVVIVDEANMVGNHLWEPFLKHATEKGAKVLIVQDPAQIKSRAPGDTGRLMAQKFGFVVTTDVVRQRIPWQRECSKHLNAHQVLDGLMSYYEKNHMTWFDTKDQLTQSLTQAYVKDFLDNPTQTRMALAYRNVDVAILNKSISHALIEKGCLRGGSEESAHQEFTIKGERYTIGDRIRFTQNDHHGRFVRNLPSTTQSQPVGIKNGTLGVIEAYDEATSHLTVYLEGGRQVQLNTQDYTAITHGYAMGIHKSEGSTFDRSFVALDPMMDPSTLLVAMTRHRADVQVYIDQEQFVDFKSVVDRIGRPTSKDTVQDYHISLDQKPAFDRVQQYRDLIQEAATLRVEMEGDGNMPFYAHASYPAYQTLVQAKQHLATDILKDWESHAPYVRLAGIRKDVLEVEAGLKTRLLSDLEHRTSLQVQLYVQSVRETRALWKVISSSEGTSAQPWVLASSHPLYEDYQARKADRDSIAAVLQEMPRLYAPFFRVTTDAMSGERRDYWGEKIEKEDRIYAISVKAHATAHHKAQLNTLFVERFSSKEKSHYEDVKNYVNARNAAAAIYGQIKKLETSSVRGIETFRDHQTTRDASALKLVESPEKYQPFFALLNVKEDRLLEHAVAGELREKISSYVNEQDIALRASRAQELKRIMSTPSDHQIFTEATKSLESIDLNRLTFDIALHEKVKVGTIDASVSPDQLYKPIQDYLNASREAGMVWKAAQKVFDNSEPKNKEGFNNTWKSALKDRHEAAKMLKDDSVAFSILGGMGQGFQKCVHGHAGEGFDKSPQTRKTPQKDDVQPFLSATSVLEEAKGHAADLATELLGSPNRTVSSKTALRFGNKGSLVMNVSGTKAGLWKDFESGEGGNIFHLVQREKGLNFKESLAYVATSLNLNMDPVKIDLLKEQKAPSLTPVSPPEEPKETALERASKLNTVSELQMKSKPLKGTVAETYLREIRGIRGELASDLRYLPKGTSFFYKEERKTLASPYLAAFGRSEDGQSQTGRLSSVQLTRLTETGQRALTPEGEKHPKIHYGIAKGSFVCVQEDNSHDRVFIAEGLETALSLKDAGLKGRIVASLGIHNMANYKGSEKEIILCGDNDDHKTNSQIHGILEKTRDQMAAGDKSVSIIKPVTPGDDFNDVLKKQGITGVQAYMKPYLDPSKQMGLSHSSPVHSSLTKDQKVEHLDHVHTTSGSAFGTDKYGTDKSDSMADIAGYLRDKVNDLHAYKGTSLEKQARQELREYMKALEQNDGFFERFRLHDKELAKELDTFKQQERFNKDRDHHIKILDRGKDLWL